MTAPFPGTQITSTPLWRGVRNLIAPENDILQVPSLW